MCSRMPQRLFSCFLQVISLTVLYLQCARKEWTQELASYLKFFLLFHVVCCIIFQTYTVRIGWCIGMLKFMPEKPESHFWVLKQCSQAFICAWFELCLACKSHWIKANCQVNTKHIFISAVHLYH